MKRFFESYLTSWKNNPNRKPLIVRGARQVGKTYTIEKFGKESFENYIRINPEQDENLKKVFSSRNPQLIAGELSALYGVPVIEGKTLLFIDEIQLLPEAIISLRYFYEQMRGLHVIAAGSLLDHTLNELPYSMPVGRVEFAYMYPLNFMEFLIANEQKSLADYISGFSFERQYSEAIHSKISEYLRLYFFIGGMPEAVRIYITTKNLIEVEKVHAGIITSFQYDFAKYGTRKQQEYLKECLSYTANNIGKKVKYSAIDKSVHSSYLKEALLKLEMSRIIHLVRKTKSSKVPINQYVDNNIFKPVFLDIGLVCNMSNIRLTDIQNLITDFEGALAEQFVGQELISSFECYEDARLYYWIREEKNANAEIDFLYQIENKIYPVEVKAGKTGTLKSLQVYLAEKKEETGIRLNSDMPSAGANLTANVNIKKQRYSFKYNLISLPVYFASDLKRICSEYVKSKMVP
jgi:predicted AAA+ superfamily ATPase